MQQATLEWRDWQSSPMGKEIASQTALAMTALANGARKQRSQ